MWVLCLSGVRTVGSGVLIRLQKKIESEIEFDFWNPVPDPKPATFYELKFKHEIVKT